MRLKLNFCSLTLFHNSTLARVPPIIHHVVATSKTENTVTPDITGIFPTAVNHYRRLDFALGTASNERDIYVYSMQVYPNQQDLRTEPVSDKIKESSDLIPPRIQQNVHGYFNLKADHPTRLNLCGSWDKNTVSSFQVCMTKLDL